ncbi:MAG: ribosome small subunit-dependent GTPase A [Caldithrix sp.]|nr:ribosome small subunit-dependent GTPase A [Caldithrix sp.]
MGKLTKRQRQRLKYELREKENRKKKQAILHEGQTPKYIERHIPYIRKLAPNLDQIMIVSSFISPPFKSGLIDRFLVLAELEKIHPIIVLNKVDLLQNPAEAEEIVDVYSNIGYHTIATSVQEQWNLAQLHKCLHNKRTALAGHSGVGKSSLLNALYPDLKINVNEVSHVTNKGKHTTTQIKIYNLDNGTQVIDLPGIKMLDFIDISRKELRFYFKEMREVADDCKFRDCLHLAEIECAVKNAVDEKRIHPWRYESYKNFIDTLD